MLSSDRPLQAGTMQSSWILTTVLQCRFYYSWFLIVYQIDSWAWRIQGFSFWESLSLGFLFFHLLLICTLVLPNCHSPGCSWPKVFLPAPWSILCHLFPSHLSFEIHGKSSVNFLSRIPSFILHSIVTFTLHFVFRC